MESSSYFGRPLESQSVLPSRPAARSSSSSVEQQNQQDQFVPSIIDIAYSAKHHAYSRSIADVRVPIPQFYLQPQAVDTAVEIGHGATFTVYQRKIPEHIQQQRTAKLGGVFLTSKGVRPNWPKYVVYKVPRVAFNACGESAQTNGDAVRAMVIEMRALAHEPLLRHHNIVRLFGLAWGSGEGDTSQRLPILVNEFASHGTLADLQAAVRLPVQTRFNLCADVSEGLSVLHRSAIMHGDLKSENILIFPSDDDRRYVAKVADFGFSIVGMAAGSSARFGGTRPWQAPETNRPVPRHLLVCPDVFSLGLLIWRVVCECSNPFALVTDTDLSMDALLTAADELKVRRDFHNMVHLENWYPVVLRKTKLMACQPHEPPTADTRGVTERALQQHLAKLQLTANSAQVARLFSLIMDRAPNVIPYRKLFDSIADCCLKVDPAERSLNKVRELLQDYRSDESAASANGVQQLDAGLTRHHFSWADIPELDPDIQAVVGQALQNQIASLRTRNLLNEGAYMMLAAMHTNGHGVEKDYEKVKSLLELCAMSGQVLCQAYAYRIINALGLSTDGRHLNWLARMSSLGSRTAMDDLAILEPETARSYRQMNRDWKSGVGARIYSTAFMLHRMTLDDWLKLFDSESDLLEKISSMGEVSTIRVNEWGDSLLHMTASCGKESALKMLLQKFSHNFDINQKNSQNETPLFCACRSGQLHTLKVLLSHGADAKIGKHRGEQPIHWLVSFDPGTVAEAASLLFAAGASAMCLTTDNISYTHFPPGLETDHKFPGSPLLWAVHENREDIVRILMSQDEALALAFLKYGQRKNPLELAAYYHQVGCLKIMIHKSQEMQRATAYRLLLRAAQQGGNRFDMILRHGNQWRKRLTETFQYLVDLAKDSAFSHGFDGFGSSLLLEAISYQYPDVVQTLLEHGLELTETFHRVKEAGQDPSQKQEDLELYGVIRQHHINQACGEHGRTPILEAVHTGQWDVYEMLLAYGADPLQTIKNPFTRDESSWTALHVLARARNRSSAEFLDHLISAGVPVDGFSKDATLVCETPLMVAIFNDGWSIADKLFEHGADVNAVTKVCGFIELEDPTTLLGHIAASAARNSLARLRYLLHDCPKHEEVKFVVEPGRQLTALHRIALGNQGVSERGSDITSWTPVAFQQYNFAANREICYEVLQHFDKADQIDAQEASRGYTALMLSVEAHNSSVVALLLDRGAKTNIANHRGETVFDLVQHIEDPGHSKAMSKAIGEVRSMVLAKKREMGIVLTASGSVG